MFKRFLTLALVSLHTRVKDIILVQTHLYMFAIMLGLTVSLVVNEDVKHMPGSTTYTKILLHNVKSHYWIYVGLPKNGSCIAIYQAEKW